uniref:Reverse transcriptase domain-containing protein n=1 Tax=Tanacetum cinerariifolium TaxID=118510 RepID=A0A6L2K2Q3_TANCI|nr:hypothetical protein [Tanacetum cinerariifolium]
MVELKNDVSKPVKTSDEPFRKETKESIKEEIKMAELPEPQPVSFYLNRKINEKLIGGLIGNPRGKKDMSALVDQGSDVRVMPLSVYDRLTNQKLVETDVRLALASNSYIYPLGVAEDVLVEVTDFVYPVDFMIFNIEEDVKNPFILGSPFLTTARAEIKFDKERGENKVNTLSIVNERFLEWEEKIKFHHMKELEFEAWKSKYSKSKALTPKDESSSRTSENHGGIT